MWIFTISTGAEFPSTVAKHSSLWTLTHRCCYTMLHQVVKGFGTHASWCTPVSTIVALYVFSLTYYDSKTNMIWLMTYTSKHAYWSACQHHFPLKLSKWYPDVFWHRKKFPHHIRLEGIACACNNGPWPQSMKKSFQLLATPKTTTSTTFTYSDHKMIYSRYRSL